MSAGVEDEEVGGEDLQELQMGTRRRTKNMASGSSILVIFTFWDVTQPHPARFLKFFTSRNHLSLLVTSRNDRKASVGT
jgi:hypothetical protein